MSLLVLAHKADKRIIELKQLAEGLHMNEVPFRNWAVMPTATASPGSLTNAMTWCGKWSRLWDSSLSLFDGCTLI